MFMFLKSKILKTILFVTLFFPMVTYAQQAYPDGTLLRARGYSGVYVFDKGTVRVIPSIEVFKSYNYDWNKVQEVDYVIHEQYPKTRLIKTSNNSKVYYLTDAGRRLWIPTAEMFINIGYHSVGEEVTLINNLELGYYKDEQFIKSNQNDKTTAYRVSSFGTKRAINNQEIFESYSSDWSSIHDVPDQIITSYPETKLIRQKGDYKVYSLENGMRRWITSLQAFEQQGFSWERIEDITEVDLKSYPEGTDINSK